MPLLLNAIDRTNEFRHLIKEAQCTFEENPICYENSKTVVSPNKSILDERFSCIAASIGSELTETQNKISELEQLVQRRSIFDDKTAEMQALTFHIRQAIVQLNSKIESFAKQEPKNSENSFAMSHDVAHHRSVIQTLRMQWGEATMRLKKTLELRAETMKEQESRRNLYSAASIWNRPTATLQHQNDDYERDQLVEDNNINDDTQSFFGPTQIQQQKPFYQSARAEAVESVQKMVNELAQIFSRVASLVTAQEELTLRIEDDMSAAMHNLYQGEVHLLKYFRTISSNRTLILKVFAILILFIVFFVIFLS